MLTTIDILESLTPMLAQAGRPDVLDSLVGGWVFDEKVDGIRAIAAWDADAFQIRNRNGREITMRYPELCVEGTRIKGPLILDGEIVAADGSFQDIAWRDKQNGAGADKVPANFVAFDVLYHPEHGDVRSHPYAHRRQLLNALDLTGSFRTSLCSPDPRHFDRLKSIGAEGVVAKRLNARYAKGRSADWLKVKALYTVSALATGYEPGDGARAHMGAILLSTLSATPTGYMLHQIGKAGSGFTSTPGRGTTSHEMKDLIDSATSIHDVPIVEIECLGATRSGVLRQPIFKGLRTDLSYQDCLQSQVDALPRS